MPILVDKQPSNRSVLRRVIIPPNQHSETEPPRMPGAPSISNVRHACLTHGIDNITDFEVADEFASFKGTYYHPSHKGETWLFFAHNRKGGGIDITPVRDVSVQEPGITGSNINTAHEPSRSMEAQYDEETLEYLIEACQHLAGLQKTLRRYPEFLEEERKILDACFAISRKIDSHLSAKQKDKLSYMFY